MTKPQICDSVIFRGG